MSVVIRSTSELHQARELLASYPRAAGAIAGVALERVLLGLAAQSGIVCAPSILAAAHMLRRAGLLDSELHAAVKRAAIIRARCVHAAHTPTRTQVEHMLARVYQIVAALAEVTR